MNSTAYRLALVVAAIVAVAACGPDTPKPLPSPPGQKPGTQTAGVPVKVSLPPEVPSGSEFPIVVKFDGWKSPGGPFELDYSPTEPLARAPKRENAGAPVTVVMAQAKDDRTADTDVTVTATTTKGSAKGTTTVRRKSSTQTPPSPAGIVDRIDVADVGPGSAATVKVTMRNFTAPADATIVYVSSADGLSRPPAPVAATAQSWEFKVSVPPDTEVGEACVVGISFAPDRSDVRWMTFRVR